MKPCRPLLALHARLDNLNRLARQGYLRLVIGEPTLSLYFPIYIHPLRNLRVGKNVALSAFVHIIANDTVTIGDDTIIASGVQLTTSTHSLDVTPFRARRLDAPITIGSNVWIGAGAIVLPGISIGDNSMIGAGSVVTRDVAPDTLVVGSPARPVRRLFGIDERPPG